MKRRKNLDTSTQEFMRLQALNRDLVGALKRHEWYGTDWDTWRCASCSAEIQDGEEYRHDGSCPTAALIVKAES